MEQSLQDALPVILSNLQKASEKQQHYDSAEIFAKLSRGLYQNMQQGDFAEIKEMIVSDIADISTIYEIAAEAGDRGTLRALTWGGKVAAIQKSLIDRYLSKGEALIEEKDLFVCEACGFIFLGDEVPAICPVCKAPSSRFSKVGR